MLMAGLRAGLLTWDTENAMLPAVKGRATGRTSMAARGWELLARIANIVQVSDLVPRNLRDVALWAINAVAVSLMRWLLGLTSAADPLYLWVGSIVIVFGVIWSAVGVRRLMGISSVPETRSSGVEYLGPSPVGGDDPSWMIFRVANVLKALHIQAYLYYTDDERTPEAKQKIHNYLAANQGLKFYRWDMLKATDRPEFIREALGHYIMEGTELCHRLRQFGEEEGPGAGVSLLGQKVHDREVASWERTVVDLLVRSYKRSSESDFMRDVGTVPHGMRPLLHRMEARVERLQNIKDQI